MNGDGLSQELAGLGQSTSDPDNALPPDIGDDALAQQLRVYAAIAAERANVGGGGGAVQPVRPPSAPRPSVDPSVSHGSLAAGLRGAVDTATFGFGDELGGLADTVARRGPINSNATFADRLASNIAIRRQTMAQDEADHSVSRGLGQLYGALAIPAGAVDHGALAVAKVGAVQGAAYGAGSGGDTGQGTTAEIEDRAKEAAEGGVVGGIVGGVIGKVTELASPYVSRALNAFRGATTEDATGALSGEALSQEADKFTAAEMGDDTVIAPDGSTNRPPLQDAGSGTARRLATGPGTVAAAWGTNAAGERVPVLAQRAEGGSLDDILSIPHDGAEPFIRERGVAGIEGGAAHAGTIDRAGLQGLQEDVAAFRERVEAGDSRAPDINPDTSPEAAGRVGNFRLGNLGNGDDTANLLGAIARQLPAKGIRSDAELMATAKAAADDTGEDPEAFLATAQALAGRLGDADTTMAVLRTVMAKAADTVNRVHLAGVDWSTASDDAVAYAGQSIRNLSLLSQMVQTAKVGLGRGLRVNSLPDAETYLAQLAERDRAEAAGEHLPTPGEIGDPRTPPPLPGSREELQDWFDRWGALDGSPEAQANYLQGLLTVPTASKYLRQSFANFFTGSILSAPKTLALNVVSPAVVGVVHTLERMVGGAVGAINPLASAEQRAAAGEVARAAPIAYLQTINEIGDAFRFARQGLETNKSVIGGGGTTIDPSTTYGPLTTNLLLASGAEPSLGYTLGNLINVFPRAVSKINVGLDEFAKRLSYQGEVRARAMVEAAGKGLEGTAVRAFVQDRMRAAYDAVGHATDEAMLQSAERTTMTGPVGNPGGYTARAADFVMALRKDIPEVRYILPVFNVPANALGETLRRLPISRLPGLGSYLFPETAAELAGERGVVAQADAHGRMLLGSAFLMGGLLLNRAGLLTGAGPQDKTDRSVWLNSHQPYSIRVGDEWVRYDKFDIAGGLLSIPATIADATVYRPADHGVGDMMLSGAGALAQWLKDRASLRTAAGLFELGDNPAANIGNFASRTLGSISAGFIPRAVQSMGVDTTDPYVRMRRTWEDYMKAAVPGLSNTLEPVRNVLGEPVNRSADTFAEAVFPVVMAPTTSYAKDPVLDELDRVYRVTGYAGGADPHAIGYGYFNPKDVKLEDGRSIYDHAMQDRQTMQLDGLTLRQTLNSLIDSPEYNAAVDADSGQKQTSRGDDSRGYMLRQVFDRFNQAIKSQIASDSPLADRWLTAASAKQRDDAYLRSVPVEDLVNNPDLYATHGINAEAYSEKIKAKAPDAGLASALALFN